MPTKLKSKTNRQNAAKSTGPKTDEGKQVVALNGISHGLRTSKPVIPGLETENEWEAHRSLMFAEFKPKGALETALADRVALGFWRLARCVEAQPRILQAIQEKRKWISISNSLGEEGFRKFGQSAEVIYNNLVDDGIRLKSIALLWDALTSENIDSDLDSNLADDFINSFCSPEEWAQLEDEFAESFDWPPTKHSDLRAMVHWLLQYLAEDPDAFFTHLAELARAKYSQIARILARIDKAAKQAEELAFVETDAVEKVDRYETSTHRTLQKDLQQLERVQARREGQHVPVPISLSVTTDI